MIGVDEAAACAIYSPYHCFRVEPTMNSKLALVLFLLLVVGGGSLIGAMTAPGAWYASLTKPAFNPPNWVFGPVWTALYVLIAIAGWRIWRVRPRGQAMAAWWLQLVLNFLWSPVFFALHSLSGALVIISMLLAAIFWFILAARRHDMVAAWLFAPYLAWVGFATLLNASLLWLN